jgi:hypothetical protein
MNEIDFKIDLNIRNNIFIEMYKHRELIGYKKTSDIWGYISGRINRSGLTYIC